MWHLSQSNLVDNVLHFPFSKLSLPPYCLYTVCSGPQSVSLPSSVVSRWRSGANASSRLYSENRSCWRCCMASVLPAITAHSHATFTHGMRHSRAFSYFIPHGLLDKSPKGKVENICTATSKQNNEWPNIKFWVKIFFPVLTPSPHCLEHEPGVKSKTCYVFHASPNVDCVYRV